MKNNQKYSKELLEELVKSSFTISDILRKLKLKLSGGNHYHLSKKIKEFSIDTSHFKQSVNNKYPTKITAKDILVLTTSGNRQKTYKLRRAMIESGKELRCESCSIESWNNKPIVLEIHHINENWLDNRIENLSFLCPNCHSQKTHNTVL